MGVIARVWLMGKNHRPEEYILTDNKLIVTTYKSKKELVREYLSNLWYILTNKLPHMDKEDEKMAALYKQVQVFLPDQAEIIMHEFITENSEEPTKKERPIYIG